MMALFKKSALLGRYLSLFPHTKRLLRYWRHQSEKLPKPLRKQAQASLKHKAFHCIGGSVYSLYPGAKRENTLEAIVALQTISDYLDNLCDRMQIADQGAFRLLHQSFLDALDPDAKYVDYYQFFPYQESSYLLQLVQSCQNAVGQMPYYSGLYPYVRKLASYYVELQVRKHEAMEPKDNVRQWIESTFPPFLPWNEWAAATGSTLGIFVCFAASYQPSSNQQAEDLFQTYFPWIQALHILLDYFIDQEEDQVHGDLNFTTFHGENKETRRRLAFFAGEAKERIRNIPYPFFHELVIDGLFALYLSDPKTTHQQIGQTASSRQYLEFSPLYPLCGLLRRLRVL